MEDAMMAAMMPRMKQKVLAEEKMMLEAKKCFSTADTLKEAKTCADKLNEGDEDEDIEIEDWNENTKKETLGFIDQALAGMECIKKAETMQQMKGCMR